MSDPTEAITRAQLALVEQILALALATEAADAVDAARLPRIGPTRIVLDRDTYLALDEDQRVRVDCATAEHTRRWVETLATLEAQGRRLLEIHENEGGSLWDAYVDEPSYDASR